MPNLSLADLQALARATGFPDPALAAAVAMAESGGNPLIVGDQGTSYGLWQIHVPDHPAYNAASLLDPTYNAQAAYAISQQGKNWQPWTAYTNGRYAQYYQPAAAASSTTAKETVAGLVVGAAVASATGIAVESAWKALARPGGGGMMTAGKIGLGLVGAVALVGLGYAASSRSSSAVTPPPTPTPTPGVPPAGSVVWIVATSIAPGGTVRISVPASWYASTAAFETFLASAPFQQLANAPTIQAWSPGDPQLPADWPADDTGAASEYHAQFVYGGQVALSVASLQAIAPGLLAWVPKGTGA